MRLLLLLVTNTASKLVRPQRKAKREPHLFPALLRDRPRNLLQTSLPQERCRLGCVPIDKGEIDRYHYFQTPFRALRSRPFHSSNVSPRERFDPSLPSAFPLLQRFS